MSTLAQARARIADDLNRSNLSTQIDKAINRAIIHYQKEPFWFKETSGTFSTVAGQKAYTAAEMVLTDIKRIHFAEVVLSGGDVPLKQLDISVLESMNPNDSQGDPSAYAHWQSKVWLYLVPNAVRTVRLYYTKTYAALSLDADTNDWLVYAEDLIESRARWWINARLLKSFDKAQAAKLEELEALEGLRSQNEDYASSQPMTPVPF